MTDKQIKKEGFWRQYRNEIVVGVLIVVIGSVAYALISGIGTTIYTWIFGDGKMEISQQDEFSIETSQLPTASLTLQEYRLDSVSTTTVELLEQIRTKHNVRQILPLESDLTVRELPPLTYFFVSTVYLRVAPYENFLAILNSRVNRFNSYIDLYFELHKIDSDEIYLLGFVSDESYIRAVKNDPTSKNLVIFPRQVDGSDYLIVVPIQAITEAKDRVIEFDDGSTVGVIDVKIKL